MADWYRHWARVETHGASPTYERLALAVADDPEVLALLATVEPGRRQPNLLFGALRWHDVDVGDPVSSLAWVRDHPDEVVHLLRTRRTQTNEANRSAVLLPALARLPQPLALIEVGSSAGLCLLYEHWRYHYVGEDMDHYVGRTNSRVTLRCNISGNVPLPSEVPRIGWRAGLDVDPVDAGDPEARRWLRCLVWPEHEDRARTLVDALNVAAEVHPPVRRGDLTRDLAGLLDEVPDGATTVVTHSAALTYVDTAARENVVQLLSQRGVHRLGAEGPDVLPHLVGLLPDHPQPEGRVVVSLDDQALALAHPHGRTLAWL